MIIDENTLPSSWAYTALGDVCKLRNGYAFKSDKYIKGEGVPVIRISDIGEGKVDLNDCVKIKSHEDFEPYELYTGDILVAMSGATTGKFGIYNSTEKAYQNQRVGKFQIKELDLLDNSFLLYLLFGLKRKILEDAYGGAQPNISSGKIEEMLVPLPPLAEQQRIVAKIEELFSSLDKGIETLKTAQQQLKVYRQAVLKYAFEGRLTNPNLKEGELPEGWVSSTLGNVTIEKSGLRRGPFGSAIKKEFFVEKGFKVYEQGNAINNDPYRGKYFISKAKFEELKNFEVKPSDLLVSCSGVTLGRIVEIPDDAQAGVINQALLRIRLKPGLIANKYFIHHFRAEFFQRKIFEQSQGTAMPNLVGIKDFKEIEILVPSPEEQEKVIQEIESRLSVCDKIEESIQQGLQQAEALRQSILKKAFEGKLVPQNPMDEPASVLLERIKAEREANKLQKPVKAVKTKTKKVKV